MDTVVVSPSFQVRIPRHVCKALGIQPGQCLRIVRHNTRLELIPLRPAFEAPALFGPSPLPRVAEEGRAIDAAD